MRSGVLDRLLARARRVPRCLLALGRRALERLALDVRGGRLGRGEDALHLRGGLGCERGRPAGCGALALALALHGLREIPQVGVHGRGVVSAAADRKVAPFDPLAVELHGGHPRPWRGPRADPPRADAVRASAPLQLVQMLQDSGQRGRSPTALFSGAAYSWSSASTVFELLVTGEPSPSGGVPVSLATLV